jgi:hypothetical protein
VGQGLAVYTMAMGSRGLSEPPVAGLRSEALGRARRTPHRPAWGASFRRIQLEDIAPTKHELVETTRGRMPEQVAFGYVRAACGAYGGRRDGGLTLNSSRFWGGPL